LYGQAIIYQELSYMVRMVVMSCEIIDRRREEEQLWTKGDEGEWSID
jgi:hypothetical protein